jgi:DNA-binding protein YbaB
MFDKLKQIRELKALNDSLAQEKETVEKEGIKVVINGKLNIEEIQLNSKLEKEEEERIVKECLNEAIKKIQMTAAKKMSQIQGFGA